MQKTNKEFVEWKDMIEVNNLTKKYGEKEVLGIAELEIPKGQSFGLVGNNGAGKTTFFSLVLDLIRPSSGYVKIKGIQVNRSEEWKNFASAFLDDSFLIGYLTPEEYFYFIGELRGWHKPEVDNFLKGLEEFFNEEVLNQKKYIRDLSKGNQKKVGITSTLIGAPELIVLDEPFANLDPSSQIRLKDLLKELTRTREVTVLISSHDLGHVTEVTERIAVLEKGAIRKDLETNAETLKELDEFFRKDLRRPEADS